MHVLSKKLPIWSSTTLVKDIIFRSSKCRIQIVLYIIEHVDIDDHRADEFECNQSVFLVNDLQLSVNNIKCLF